MLGLQSKRLASTSIQHLWSLGFGNVSAKTIIGFKFRGSAGIILLILISNAPQIILSFLYFSFNGLLTCMLLAEEWSGYSDHRKAIRVSSPKEQQRTTYRLQLPYKYGVPLIVASSILHWLVSQSIFFARIVVLDPLNNQIPNISKASCAYSPIAMIFVIIFGTVVLAVGIAIGFRRYKAGMPLVGSCSAAISPACHGPKEDVGAARKPLMWGVVAQADVEDGDKGAGRCSFTSFDVDPPLVGEQYMGVPTLYDDRNRNMNFKGPLLALGHSLSTATSMSKLRSYQRSRADRG